MKIKNRKEYKIALFFVTGVGMRLECFKMYLKSTEGNKSWGNQFTNFNYKYYIYTYA